MGWIGLGAAYLVIFLIGRWGLRPSGAARIPGWCVRSPSGCRPDGQFGIQPLMVQLKADAFPRDVMESVMRDRFVAWLPGVSSILYLVQSLLGLWLVVWSDEGLR